MKKTTTIIDDIIEAYKGTGDRAAVIKVFTPIIEKWIAHKVIVRQKRKSSPSPSAIPIPNNDVFETINPWPVLKQRRKDLCLSADNVASAISGRYRVSGSTIHHQEKGSIKVPDFALAKYLAEYYDNYEASIYQTDGQNTSSERRIKKHKPQNAIAQPAQSKFAKLRKRRIKLGLSGEDVVNHLKSAGFDISQAAISRNELGSKRPNIKLLKALIKLYAKLKKKDYTNEFEMPEEPGTEAALGHTNKLRITLRNRRQSLKLNHNITVVQILEHLKKQGINVPKSTLFNYESGLTKATNLRLEGALNRLYTKLENAEEIAAERQAATANKRPYKRKMKTGAPTGSAAGESGTAEQGPSSASTDFDKLSPAGSATASGTGAPEQGKVERASNNEPVTPN